MAANSPHVPILFVTWMVVVTGEFLPLVQLTSNGFAMESTPRKFYYGSTRTDWYTARRACHDSGFRLAQAKNDSKHCQVELFAMFNGLENLFWIGINDLREEGYWHWDDGSLLVGSHFAEDTYDQSKNCGAYRTSDVKWIQLPCRHIDNEGEYQALPFL